MPVLFIIFGIMLLITVIIIVINSNKRKQLVNQCTTDKDCVSGYVCLENPEEEGKTQCFPSNKKFCALDPVTELTQCSCEKMDENGNCIGESECSKCLNSPAFSCVRVTNEKPYVWQQGDKRINIPNSEEGKGWCLPNVINRNVTCNPFTSDYILAEVGPNQYQWGCYCKHENLFEHSQGPLSDCTLVKACRTSHGTTEQLGGLYVPEPSKQLCTEDSQCGEKGKCLSPHSPAPCGYDFKNGPKQSIIKDDCKDPNNKCVCHVPWQGDITNIVDPLTGQCVCNKGLQYQCVVRSSNYFEMNCVKGFCDPFDVDDSKQCNEKQCYDPSKTGKCTCCKCPPGYIRCPDDIPLGNEGLVLYCKNTGPTCIADPCSTKDVPDGYYDPSLPGCVCPGASNIALQDENSAVGQVCTNACKGNGPCGKRGKCYLPEDAKSYHDALCCDCQCPYTNDGDPSCSCSGVSWHGHNMPKVRNRQKCRHDSECCSGNCAGDGKCLGETPPTSPCGKSTCTRKLVCPDNSPCPLDNICCGDGKGNYSCCSEPGGVCCGDGKHCCPAENTCCDSGCCPASHPICDNVNKKCTKNDGTDPIPWNSF
jgi:hypothetical protein